MLCGDFADGVGFHFDRVCAGGFEGRFFFGWGGEDGGGLEEAAWAGVELGEERFELGCLRGIVEEVAVLEGGVECSGEA